MAENKSGIISYEAMGAVSDDLGKLGFSQDYTRSEQMGPGLDVHFVRKSDDVLPELAATLRCQREGFAVTINDFHHTPQWDFTSGPSKWDEVTPAVETYLKEKRAQMNS